MKKLIIFNMITLDGFFEGVNKEIDWHNVDEEFNEFAIKQLDSVEAILFGRITYELMASYWPAQQAKEDDPIIAEKMNSKQKYVFSKSLKNAEWENTKLISNNIEKEINELKNQAKKDLIIFGSGNLSTNLLNLNLVDEIRLIINPVILGKGHLLFEDIRNHMKIHLLKTHTFNSGNVLLAYKIN